MSRIIAIDFGLKRTGVAVTDPLKIIATSLTTVNTNEFFTFFENYHKNEKIEELVIGYPKHLNNQDVEIVEDIKKFAENFKQKYVEIKVTFYDERYTSKMASFAMVQAGFKKKDRQNKANIDKMSAAILLQNYLEYKKNKIE